MTVTPSRGASFCARMRANVSLLAPGGNGTTMVICFGQVTPCAKPSEAHSQTQTIAAQLTATMRRNRSALMHAAPLSFDLDAGIFGDLAPFRDLGRDERGELGASAAGRNEGQRLEPLLHGRLLEELLHLRVEP